MTNKNTYQLTLTIAEPPKERILSIQGTLTESQAKKLHDLLGPTSSICFGLYSALNEVLHHGKTTFTEGDDD